MSGVPYHAWTHQPKAQGGTDPIEVASGTSSYFHAYLMQFSGSPIPGAGTAALPTPSDSSSDIMVFDWWDTDNTDVFEPMAASGFSNPPVIGVDVIQNIWLKKPGSYTIGFNFDLPVDFYGYAWHWNDSDSPFGYADSFVGGGSTYPGSSATYNITGMVGGAIHVVYPIPDYATEGADPTDPDEMWGEDGFVQGYITMNVMPEAGGSVTVRYGQLRILYTPSAQLTSRFP